MLTMMQQGNGWLYRTGLILCVMIAWTVAGCSQTTVDEDQPADQFVKDAKVKLAGLEQRIDNVKADKDQLPADKATIVENATEMAEEKAETLRDSTLPKLQDATSKEQIEQLKALTNTTLEEIVAQVEKAEDAAGEQTEHARFYDQTKNELAALNEHLGQIRDKAGQLGGSARAKLDQALESAEESIDQAGSSLEQYKNTAQDQSLQLEKNIEGLVDKARENINQAAETIAENTESN